MQRQIANQMFSHISVNSLVKEGTMLPSLEKHFKLCPMEKVLVPINFQIMWLIVGLNKFVTQQVV